MIARAAMWNMSIFSQNGMQDLDIVIKRFLEIVNILYWFCFIIKYYLIILTIIKCLETNNFFFSTKYVVQQMLHNELTSERGEAVLASLSDDQI